MTESRYLIAHKVRGEPAFDVAIKMECPRCRGTAETNTGAAYHDCGECDGHGHWWIIPTSGHRAHPYYHIELSEIRLYDGETYYGLTSEPELMNGMPPDLPEHYQDSRAPAPSRPAFLDKLIKPKAPSTPIPRRGF